MDKISFTLPKLGDDNFDQWLLSLELLARAAGTVELINHVKVIDMDTVIKGDPLVAKTYFMIAHMMVASMNNKARRIATGGGAVEDAQLGIMIKRLIAHHNPMTNCSNIQLRKKLYTL